MGHIRRREEESWASALVLELVGMTDWYELVELAVHDKGRACHLIHSAQIVKLLSQKEA